MKVNKRKLIREFWLKKDHEILFPDWIIESANDNSPFTKIELIALKEYFKKMDKS